MSLKQEIETWVQALGHYDNNEFEESIRIFEAIADTSKILFNCGVIHATIGEHDQAVACYQRAIGLDQYLAVAYFQQGVSNFLVGDFEEALANFNDTLLYLRGNTYIDYEQLGLKFKLYSCEVLFNRGLCYIYLRQDKPGMQDFTFAVKEKMTPDHDVIDDAIRERAVGYTVFSIPVGVIYRPNEAKVKNLKTKDYLGKARLIATATSNTSIGFTGAEERQQLVFESSARDDRLPENISYAATNMVDRNIVSRRAMREQSAPPSLNRNMFPPTPPPENEKPQRTSSSTAASLPFRTSSGSSPNAKSSKSPAPYQDHRPSQPSRSQTYGPPSLNLSKTTPIPTPESQHGWQRPPTEAPRRGTARTASEPRGPPSRRMFHERTNSARAPPPAPLFRETTPQAVQDIANMNPTVDDVYNMYSKPPQKSKRSRRTIEQQHYLDEEDEYILESPDENNYDASPPNGTFGSTQSRHSAHQSIMSQPSTRRSDMRKVRIKVHTKDDTRYILVNDNQLKYDDFEYKIREKFGMRGRIKIKMQDLDDDSGQMITMSDQDDLDVLLTYVRDVALRERSEMGKMEVWLQEVF